jgi:hypothetical protein
MQLGWLETGFPVHNLQFNLHTTSCVVDEETLGQVVHVSFKFPCAKHHHL